MEKPSPTINNEFFEEVNWFKTPKKLLLCKKYQGLSIYAKVLLPNLFSMNNTYKGEAFHQKMIDVQSFTRMSPYQIRVAKKELKIFGVKIFRKNNDVYFDVSSVYKKYVGKKERY